MCRVPLPLTQRSDSPQLRVGDVRRMRDAARDGDVQLVNDHLLADPACLNRRDRWRPRLTPPPAPPLPHPPL